MDAWAHSKIIWIIIGNMHSFFMKIITYLISSENERTLAFDDIFKIVAYSFLLSYVFGVFCAAKYNEVL